MHGLSHERARCIIQRIAPGHRFVSVSPAYGAFTNEVRILECRTPGQNTLRLAVKLLTDDPEDASRRASADYYGLKLARAHNIPAPEPVLLDKTGVLLGVPGLVTRFVQGRQDAAPRCLQAWAESLADLLLRIHEITPNESERRNLYTGNHLGLYFLTGDWPTKMVGHPLSDIVYNAIEELRSRIRDLPAVFVHMDYWPGNVLWLNGKVSALMDWDCASFGDPALDVGYFRMNMYLRGFKGAADIFLKRYEATGSTVQNLGFWELAAAARPLPNPKDWLPMSREMGGMPVTDHEALNDYHEFVIQAKHRAYSGR